MSEQNEVDERKDDRSERTVDTPSEAPGGDVLDDASDEATKEDHTVA